MNIKLTAYKPKTNGQVMLEAVVALSLLALGTLGIFTLLSASLKMNRVSADQYIATNLAAEGVELVKNILDANLMRGDAWNAGFSNGVKEVSLTDPPIYDSVSFADSTNQSLKFDEVNRVYSYAASQDTKFRRTVEILNITSDEIRVVSRVNWRDLGNIPYEIVLENRIFNWR